MPWRLQTPFLKATNSSRFLVATALFHCRICVAVLMADYVEWTGLSVKLICLTP